MVSFPGGVSLCYGDYSDRRSRGTLQNWPLHRLEKSHDVQVPHLQGWTEFEKLWSQQAFGLKFLDDENKMEINGKLDLNDGVWLTMFKNSSRFFDTFLFSFQVYTIRRVFGALLVCFHSCHLMSFCKTLRLVSCHYRALVRKASDFLDWMGW